MKNIAYKAVIQYRGRLFSFNQGVSNSMDSLIEGKAPSDTQLVEYRKKEWVHKLEINRSLSVAKGRLFAFQHRQPAIQFLKDTASHFLPRFDFHSVQLWMCKCEGLEVVENPRSDGYPDGTTFADAIMLVKREILIPRKNLTLDKLRKLV